MSTVPVADAVAEPTVSPLMVYMLTRLPAFSPSPWRVPSKEKMAFGASSLTFVTAVASLSSVSVKLR